MMEFTREVEFTPAFDKRDSDPKKNYGIGGVDIRFLLKGKEGAIQFRLSTGWNLPHVKAEHKGRHTVCELYPMPTDLGYHSLKPMYNDHSPLTDECGVLDGKPCYYDGSGLAAERVFDVLVSEGHGGVWRELEDYYVKQFVEAQL